MIIVEIRQTKRFQKEQFHLSLITAMQNPLAATRERNKCPARFVTRSCNRIQCGPALQPKLFKNATFERRRLQGGQVCDLCVFKTNTLKSLAATAAIEWPLSSSLFDFYGEWEARDQIWKFRIGSVRIQTLNQSNRFQDRPSCSEELNSHPKRTSRSFERPTITRSHEKRRSSS